MRTLLVCLALGSCASAPKDPRRFTKPKFVKYHELFEAACGVPTGHIGSGFRKLAFPTVGRCIEHSKEGRKYYEIWIDPDTWEEADVDLRVRLMFHEFGHCALGMFKHSDDPNNLMYSNLGEGPITKLELLKLCNKEL